MLGAVLFPEEDRQTRDDRLGAEVLTLALEVALCPTYPLAIRLQATRLFLFFTVPRPVARQLMGADRDLSDFLSRLVAAGS